MATERTNLELVAAAEQTNYGLAIAALAVILALLTLGQGCGAVEEAREGAASLLGRFGERLEEFRSEDGTFTLEGLAERWGEGAPVEEGRPDDAGDPETLPPTPDADDPARAPEDGGHGGIDAAAEFTAACEVVLNCVVERCPVLGLPQLVDMQAAVGQCTAACDGVVAVEAATEVREMGCGDIWAELTSSVTWLEEACTEGIDEELLRDAWNDLEEEYGDDVEAAWDEVQEIL